MKHIFLIHLITISSICFADPKTFDWQRGTGSVEFRAIGHPSALRIIGLGERATGRFYLDGHNLKGEAEFKLSTLDTKNETRNHHMKEKYLEVERYPLAKLTLDKCELPFDLKDGASFKGVPFAGQLSLHGVTKAVTGKADIEQQNHSLSVKAEFNIKVGDFTISIPSFMGITMADDVAVTVQEKFPAD